MLAFEKEQGGVGVTAAPVRIVFRKGRGRRAIVPTHALPRQLWQGVGWREAQRSAMPMAGSLTECLPVSTRPAKRR
jgi:hypothetical protein